MANSKIQIVVTAKDEASKVFKKMSGAVKAFGVASGVAMAGIGVASIKLAGDFEESMSNINTLFDDNGEAIAELDAGIKKLLKTTPKSAEELGASAYDIVSAGISNASDALDVLENSAKLAVAGLGTTKEATDIMTSAINAFGIDAKESGRVADVFFKTVKNGKTNVSELAQGFGQVAPLANAVGVSFEEVAAITAAMTTNGLKASVAYSQQRAVLSNLLKPTAEMADLYSELNIKNIEAEISSNGFVNTVRKLSKATDGNNEMLAKAFGSVEALNAVMLLMNETGDNAIDIFADMEDGANAVDVAFEKQKKTVNATMQLLKNQFSVVLIEIGSRLLPLVVKAMEEVGSRLDEAFGVLKVVNFNEILKKAKDSVIFLEDALRPVVEFIFSLGDSLKKALEPLKPEIDELFKAFEDIKPQLIEFANILKTVIAAGLIVAIGLIVGLVTAVVKASDSIVKVIGALLLIFNNFIGFFTNIFTGQWAAAWENVKAIFQGAFDFISGMVSLILNLISGFIEGIIGFFTKLFDVLIGNSIIPDLVEGIIGWFDKMGEIVTQSIGGFIETAIDKFTNFKDSIINIMSSLVGSVQASVQKMIDALKKAPSNIGSSIGGVIQGGLGAIGLAEGGIVTKPTLAMIGEGGESEAVIPLSKLGGVGGGVTVNIGTVSGVTRETANMLAGQIGLEIKRQIRV